MPGVKVLHMADMHLDWTFAGMGIDGRRGRMRREELKEIFAGIIDLARKERVEILLVAGDLYEHANATRGLIKFIDEQFRRIPETFVFISPGNHDPFLPGSYYESYPWAPNVTIFRPEVSRVDLPDRPVSVYGWGFGAWEVHEYQLKRLRMADAGHINLLVVHGGEAPYHPLRAADLADTGADYIALGHIHQQGTVLEGRGRVIARYSGSPEALHFGEPGAHGVFVGTISKDANQMSFVQTGRRQFITKRVELVGAESPEEVMRAILQVDSEEERQQNAYRLQLSGTVHPELRLDLLVLQERLAEQFYLLRIEDQTRPDFDLERLSQERSARGLFVQRLLAMETAEPDPAMRRRIRRALALGLVAFEERRGAV